MGNPALAQLNQNQLGGMMGNLQKLKRTIEGLKTIGNPQEATNYLIRQNPNMKRALDYINANGGDPKQVFHKIAREKGIDPTQIEKALF